MYIFGKLNDVVSWILAKYFLKLSSYYKPGVTKHKTRNQVQMISVIKCIEAVKPGFHLVVGVFWVVGVSVQKLLQRLKICERLCGFH